MIRPCLLLLALAAATPAAAEVLDVRATGFTIDNSYVVPADPAKTWSALVNDVGKWWPKDHTWFGKSENLHIDARAGGCFCEIDGARQAQHMIVSYVDPGRMLRMSGGLGPLQGMGLYGALDWILEPANGGTRISLHYVVGGYTTNDLTQIAPIVDQVQNLQLGALASYLGYKAPTP
jgi:uncharacterized protein YndB with AHSA1/START domain